MIGRKGVISADLLACYSQRPTLFCLLAGNAHAELVSLLFTTKRNQCLAVATIIATPPARSGRVPFWAIMWSES